MLIWVGQTMFMCAHCPLKWNMELSYLQGQNIIKDHMQYVVV